MTAIIKAVKKFGGHVNEILRQAPLQGLVIRVVRVINIAKLCPRMIDRAMLRVELFKISIEKLRGKSGSQSTLKEFRRLLQTIIEDDKHHDHMPGYSFHLVQDGDMVEMRPKTSGQPRPALQHALFPLAPETYERSRELAPGWDIHALEADWRAWVSKKGITPRRADAHFMAFCKRRGKYPGFK